MSGEENLVRIVFFGPHRYGKTCLIMRYLSDDYIPECHELARAEEQFEARTIELEVYDTHAWDTGYRKKPFNIMSLVQVYVCCVSVEDPDCFWHAKHCHLCYYKEARAALQLLDDEETSPEFPKLMIIGTKTDLRGGGDSETPPQQQQNMITSEQLEEFGTEVGAALVVEVSAKENRGVKEAFRAAVELAMRGRWGDDERSRRKKKSSGGGGGFLSRIFGRRRKKPPNDSSSV